MSLLAEAASADSAERRPEHELANSSKGGRVRVILSAALGPLVAEYTAVTAVLAVVTATASQAQFSVSGVLQAALPGWLAANQVPLTISGQPLGFLPLLFSIGIFLLVARTAANAVIRLGSTDPRRDLRRLFVLLGAIAVAHAIFGFVIALSVTGERIDVSLLAAFGAPALLAGAAAAVGIGRRVKVGELVRDFVDPVAVRGLRAGALGLAGLVASGAVLVVLSVALSFPTVRALFASHAPGMGSGLGMLLLSIGYLPNAVVFGLSFSLGPGFSFGTVSLAPYHFSGGSVPGVPLLAAIPEQQASWWPACLALPLLVGVLVGWSLRRVHDQPLARLRTVGVAGAVVGFGCVLLGSLVGGRLGGGVFTPVALPVGEFSLAAFCWVVIPGGLVAWFAGTRGRPKAKPATEQPADGVPNDTTDISEAGEAAEVSNETTEEAPKEASDEVADEAAEIVPDEETSENPPEADESAQTQQAKKDRKGKDAAELGESVPTPADGDTQDTDSQSSETDTDATSGINYKDEPEVGTDNVEHPRQTTDEPAHLESPRQESEVGSTQELSEDRDQNGPADSDPLTSPPHARD